MKRESGKRKRMLVCTATTVRSSSLLRVGRRHKSCIQTLGVQCLRRCRCHCRAWCDVCGVVWCMLCIVPQRRGTSIQSVVSGFLGLRRKKVVSDSLGRDRREKKLGGKESTLTNLNPYPRQPPSPYHPSSRSTTLASHLP